MGRDRQVGPPLNRPMNRHVFNLDYNCLIAENGDLTPKYYKAKEIIQRLAAEQG